MARQNRRPGWWYPWLFVAFFGVVVAANGIMIYLATATFPGLSAEDAYRTGIVYDAALAEAEQQQERGWTGDLRVDQGASRTGQFTFTVADKDGTPITDLKVRAKLRRPGDASKDFTVTFQHTDGGRYVADTRFPDTGQWEVFLAAARDGEVLYRTTAETVVQ